MPWAASNPAVRYALWALAAFLIPQLTFHAYYPHYSAPIIGLFSVLVLEGWRQLRVWRWQRQPVGRAVSRILPIVSLVLLVVTAADESFRYDFTYRDRFVRDLEQLGGKHLVFVRYRQPGHHPDDEWVYNKADIDRSNVVWARPWTAESNKRLRQYFADRRVWIAEPDAQPPRLTEQREEVSPGPDDLGPPPRIASR
jgi:hypothetical protein